MKKNVESIKVGDLIGEFDFPNIPVYIYTDESFEVGLFTPPNPGQNLSIHYGDMKVIELTQDYLKINSVSYNTFDMEEIRLALKKIRTKMKKKTKEDNLRS